MTAKNAKAPTSEMRFLRDYLAWRGVVEAARSGRSPEARIARGRELAQRYPERIEVHRTLEELYMEVGDDESSIDPFRRVLGLDPCDVKNRLRLSRAVAGTGAYDDAPAMIVPVVEDAPTPRNLVKLGAVLADVRAVFEAPSRERSGEVLPFTPAR